MAVLIDTATGADSVKVEVKAGTSGTMIASIDASTSTNSDTVEIKAESNGANLDISASHSMSTNDDKVIMEVNGQGSADWLKAKLVAKDNSGDNAEMIVTSDARNVTVGYGVAPTFYPPTDWNPNGFSVTSALATSKLIVEHKATTGTLLANLSVLAGNSVVELKGTTSKVVTGTVGGNQTTLFAEGPASGSVVTTGTGSLPKCIVNVGTSVNCTP